jgi:hypothetical protein
MKGHTEQALTMQEQADSPSDQLAGLSLNQANEGLPDFVATPGDDDAVSFVGSSVSQNQKTTMEVDAAMINNAVAMINNLSQQVLIYYSFSVSTLTIYFIGCSFTEASCFSGYACYCCYCCNSYGNALHGANCYQDRRPICLGCKDF